MGAFIRCASFIVVVCLSSACRSSSATVLAPTAIRCVPNLQTTADPMQAGGGSGTLRITLDRECTWTARSEVAWVTLSSSATGQGNGSVSYRVAENPLVAGRLGSIAVNDQRAAITQAAAPCRFALDAAQQGFGAAGGRHRITVTAQEGCTWTAQSTAQWIVIIAGAAGTSGGSVTIELDRNNGDARSAAVMVAGQTFMVTQAAPPAPVPTPPLPTPPSAPAPVPTPPPAPRPIGATSCRASTFTRTDTTTDAASSAGHCRVRVRCLTAVSSSGRERGNNTGRLESIGPRMFLAVSLERAVDHEADSSERTGNQ